MGHGSHDRAERDERRRRKFLKQGGACWWCSRQMTLARNSDGTIPKRFATFEHIVRRVDGGVGLPNNIVLACRKCNNERDTGDGAMVPTAGLGWSLEAASP